MTLLLYLPYHVFVRYQMLSQFGPSYTVTSFKLNMFDWLAGRGIKVKTASIT